MVAALVQMKALSFFTVNSPTTGAILHGDPRDEADVIARFPRVSEDDAEYLEEAGLAERFDGRVPREKGAGAEDVNTRAGRMAEEHLEADQSVDAPTGLDTRGSTAFEKHPHLLAGQSGSGRQMVEGDLNATGTGSDEAPPGSGKAKTEPPGPTPYSQMKTADLVAEAAKDPPVDISKAKNNEERAKLLETARGSKAPAETK